jgi:hypothetical protein
MNIPQEEPLNLSKAMMFVVFFLAPPILLAICIWYFLQNQQDGEVKDRA